MNTTMISMKPTSSFFVATAITAAALFAVVYTGRKFQRRGRSTDGKGKSLDFQDGSKESLVNERFQACVQVMGPQLPRLPQRTQLDYYALYKQGALGDCKDYQSEPPPSYDLVASAKYHAWHRLNGMDRITAMQNYIEKALHFQFVNSIGEVDDQDYELEGDAAIDVMGLGDKPSTLLDDFDKDAMAMEDAQYPTHAAAREGKLLELKNLLETSGKTSTDGSNHSPNTLDDSGQTPLHLATDRGHIECVKTLILAGADVNAVDHDGISILQAAAIAGNYECCRLLLALGADPDHADNDGDTPRDSAKDDTQLRALFDSYDDKTLSFEDVLDPSFLSELNERKISIAIEVERKGVVTDVPSKQIEQGHTKDDIQILDEDIDIDLDNDGDMF